MVLPVVSYGLAAAAYAALALLLLPSLRVARDGRWVLLAVAGTALWGVAITVALLLSPGDTLRPWTTVWADALRGMVLIAFLLHVLPARPGWLSIKRVLAVAAASLTVAAMILPLVSRAADEGNL